LIRLGWLLGSLNKHMPVYYARGASLVALLNMRMHRWCSAILSAKRAADVCSRIIDAEQHPLL